MSAEVNMAAIEGFGLLNGEQLGMQSWYFGYVLAFALVLLVFFCVQMTKNGAAT